jgi:hypothetical protein
MKLDKYNIAYIVSMVVLAFTCSAIVGVVAIETCYGKLKSPLCEEINKGPGRGPFSFW